MNKNCPTCKMAIKDEKLIRCPRCNTIIKEMPKCADCKGCSIKGICPK